ncbi:DUF4244 domain-containing protein [Kitasatospora purpeofusca]|uniref:DUF4244 domain-containing protein n=1 Tax=Kitasatospora purpeofusca TaxID=67352 RepID=UPI003869A690|nr:DUF4244 domain-containing protein [Kitasatospora purpeofusca]
MNLAIGPTVVAGAGRGATGVGPGRPTGRPVVRDRHSARFVVRFVVRRAIRRRGRIGLGGPDAGMTTSEYAVGTLGACAVAAALYKVATSAAVMDALHAALDRALHAT